MHIYVEKQDRWNVDFTSSNYNYVLIIFSTHPITYM